MYCKKCGTTLEEGTEFCPKCGMAPKKSYWWVLGVLVLMILVGGFWGLTKLNILSVDSYLAQVMPIKMKPYYPVPTDDATYVGEYQGVDFSIEFEYEDEVNIDRKNYFVRTRVLEYDGSKQPSFEFLFYDEKDNLFRSLSTDEYGTAYNEDFDYDLLDQEDVVMPSSMKLGETLTFELDADKTEYTLLGFEDVVIEGKKFPNTAVIEVIFFYNDEPTAKEVTYHAKNKGMIKIETFYIDAEGDWEDELELELELD